MTFFIMWIIFVFSYCSYRIGYESGRIDEYEKIMKKCIKCERDDDCNIN